MVRCDAAVVGSVISMVGACPSRPRHRQRVGGDVVLGVTRRYGDDVGALAQRHRRHAPRGGAGGRSGAAAVVGPGHLHDADVVAGACRQSPPDVLETECVALLVGVVIVTTGARPSAIEKSIAPLQGPAPAAFEARTDHEAAPAARATPGLCGTRCPRWHSRPGSASDRPGRGGWCCCCRRPTAGSAWPSATESHSKVGRRRRVGAGRAAERRRPTARLAVMVQVNDAGSAQRAVGHRRGHRERAGLGRRAGDGAGGRREREARGSPVAEKVSGRAFGIDRRSAAE